MLNNKTDVCEPSRETKHLVIESKLTRLCLAIDDLENVLLKVRGEDFVEKKGDPVKTEIPISLVEFLDGSPDIIEKYVARLNEIRDGLNQTIF